MINFEIYIIIALLLILYFWYASIIKRQNKAFEALSSIDVQLQNRLDLIPNIIKIAKNFMSHEENIFTEITKIREDLKKPYDAKDKSQLENHIKLSQNLEQKMDALILRVENYPELRSSENMLQAQKTYNEIESHIAASRRFYNAAVNSLSNAIRIFPGNIIASIIGVKKMPLYEADIKAKEAVDVNRFL